MIAIISSDAIGIIIDAVIPATAEWAVFEESAAMRVPGHVCKGKGDE